MNGLHKTHFLGRYLWTDDPKLFELLERKQKSSILERDAESKFPGLTKAISAAMKELTDERMVVVALLHVNGRVQAQASSSFQGYASNWVEVVPHRIKGLQLITDHQPLKDMLSEGIPEEEIPNKFPGLLKAVVSGINVLESQRFVAARVTYLNFRVQVWSQPGFDAEPSPPVRVLPTGYHW